MINRGLSLDEEHEIGGGFVCCVAYITVIAELFLDVFRCLSFSPLVRDLRSSSTG